jgi:hypothetical protein
VLSGGKTMITIDDFLLTFMSKNTKIGYRLSLQQYFDFLTTPPEKYFSDSRRYETDIMRYIEHMRQQGLSDKSIISKLGAIRLYLGDNGVELPRRFWKRLKFSSVPITPDRLFTKDELKQIFTHLDVLGKSMFFIQLCAGLCIEDVLKININDLALDKNPPRF